VNLSLDQDREAANQIISAIHANANPTSETQQPSAHGDRKTFAEFLPTYFQYLKAKRRDEDQRNEMALRFCTSLLFLGPSD
jgi:hypothetical protein